MSGVLAAAYTTTALRDPAMAPAAATVYQELYYKEYHHFREMVRLFYSSNRTVESYFWEARRILDADSDANTAAGLSPRASFIQAVAGQPPRGYERMVLERGQAPAQFADSVRAVEEERASRQARIEEYLAPSDGGDGGDGGIPPILRAVPRLRPGVRVERKPVVGDGEFTWGYVLLTESHPEGLPCSSLVARLVSVIDGQTSAADLLNNLAAEVEPAQQQQLAQSIITTLQILYVDGTVAELGS